MKTVHEVSRLTGVSVRALHYYDQIGLLKPTEVTAAGYRLYGAAALTRLHAILLFRELRLCQLHLFSAFGNESADLDLIHWSSSFRCQYSKN